MFKRIFSLIFGLVFIFVGVLLFKLTAIEAKRCTLDTTATICDFKIEQEERTENGHRRTLEFYYPIVQYEINGQSITANSHSGYDKSKHYIGEQLEIKVDPNQLDYFIIANDNVFKIASIICIIIGALSILSDIFKALFRR